MKNLFKNIFNTILLATKTILENKKRFTYFLIITVLFLVAYIIVPVLATKGSTLAFQLSILKPKDYILMIILSSVTSLLIIMQTYLFSRSRKKRLATVGQGGVSIFSAFFGGLLAISACSSCIVALLGFLGAGSTFFIVRNQTYFTIGAIVIVLLALYFSSRRIAGICLSCES